MTNNNKEAPRKIRRDFWLDPERAEKVSLLAKRKMVSESEIVRRAIDKVK